MNTLNETSISLIYTPIRDDKHPQHSSSNGEAKIARVPVVPKNNVILTGSTFLEMHARIQKFSLFVMTLQLQRQNAPVILLSKVSGPLSNKRRKYTINVKIESSNFQVESNLTNPLEKKQLKIRRGSRINGDRFPK